MEHEPLTYFEKLENVYVLTETKNMLQAKLNEQTTPVEERALLEDDLRKINEEIEEYTDGQIVTPGQFTVTSLFNPAVFDEE
ncbi:hypothetical protein [Halalkalibacter akibai]|uniref:Uncharacterized protein n=1 Tax=Halalkalibacter akibai (strain ATCC 43226 / DSM 21942 / CIP 109018 / JCM 9157 / 1139) TaxID=1236973 RepID=W4QY45_HALA3|nr:hypothetical protein [Halalkalibacter akibai]GAE37001.1 hypothetical protein JCM9157_4242 [Halalkalibacter akibai JCM 9157]